MQQYRFWYLRAGRCFCAYVDEVSDYWNLLMSGCEIKKWDMHAIRHSGLVDCLLDVEAPEAILCFSGSRVLTVSSQHKPSYCCSQHQ